MAEWRIERERGWILSPGPDTDSAFVFLLRREDEASKLTVEFAAPGPGSISAARDTVRTYLGRDRLPRRLIVDRQGRVSERDD